MRRITVTLTDGEKDQLIALARHERRYPDQMAAVIIAERLRETAEQLPEVRDACPA